MRRSGSSEPTPGPASLRMSAGPVTGWAAIGVPPGVPVPSFSRNGTSASSLVGVSFARSGVYTFRVTIVNPFGQVATSDVAVAVGARA